MIHRQYVPLARRLAQLVGVFALGATTMASDCAGPESVTERSIVARIDPATRVDTTYTLDTLVYRAPFVTGSNGVGLTDFDVRWETSRATVARLLDPPVQRYSGGTTLVDSATRPLMRVEVVRDGDAVVTMTPLDVNFAGGTTQRYTATIVALANRPTTLDVQSVYNLRVGDTLSLAASPRGSSPGVFTTGSVEWTVTNAAVAQISTRPTDGGTPAVRNPITNGPLDRIGLRALAVGTTPLRVVYTGRAGVRLERTVTVNVTANAARVQIDRSTPQTIVANDVNGVIFASLLDAAGRPVDPSSLRFTSRDSIALPIRPAVTGCPATNDPTGCATIVEPNSGEIVRRGGVVRGWIVATAGTAAPDSVELTAYPAVASLEISPPSATIALGGAADFTVIARDASRNVIPAAAFPSPIVIARPPGASSAIALQLSTAGKPAMVTNVVVSAVPPGPATATAELVATRSFRTGVLEARATITVRTVDRIVVTPATATHRIGTAGVTFTAQLLDGAGRPVVDPAIRPTWTTADSSVATVAPTTDRTAVASGLRTGRTDVIASAQGVTGRASLEVTGALVTPTITVTPADLLLEVGQVGTITATVANVATPTTVEWVSRNPAVAAITPSGLSTAVRAGSPGTTYIVATYIGGAGTVRDSARVRVPVTSRVRFALLEPRAAEITAPASVTYRVSLFDSAGTVVNPTTEFASAIRYTSSRPSVATIDSTTGQATGVSGGTTVIRARYLLGGVEVASDTSTLLVYPPTAGHLGSLEISTAGNAREVRVGQDLLFQVIVRDVAGTPVRSGVTVDVGPASSPYVDVTRATEFTEGYFYRIRGKAPTPSLAVNPLAAFVLIRADVIGAGAAVPIVVRP